jgi:plastocyanin
MKRHLAPVALLVLATAVAAGCSGDDDNNTGGTGTPNSTITIVPGAFDKGMMAFSPPIDTVHVGNVVRMQNGDTSTHDIQADTGGFPSWGSLPGNTGSNVTASAVGTFGYHCVVSGHTMTGTLVVVP